MESAPTKKWRRHGPYSTPPMTPVHLPPPRRLIIPLESNLEDSPVAPHDSRASSWTRKGLGDTPLNSLNENLPLQRENPIMN